MKPALPLVTLMLAMPAALLAQDVEPTLERALAAIVAEVVAELPYRAPDAQALAVEAAPGADDAVVDAFVSRLLAEGFRVEVGPQRADHAARLVVETAPEGRPGSVRVTASGFVSERRFGRASWVDRAADKDAIVVAGSPAATRDEALASARHRLRAEIASRFPHLAGDHEFERYLSRQPTETFVAERTIHGRTRYEAYLMAQPATARLARAERAALRAEHRRPWVKAGVLAAAACVLWLLYARADFRTRGYRTRRLRLLFGTLFVALSIGLWSLPL
jgi:hypothetical protein